MGHCVGAPRTGQRAEGWGGVGWGGLPTFEQGTRRSEQERGCCLPASRGRRVRAGAVHRLLGRCLYTCAHGRVCARPMARAGEAVNRRRGRLPVPASLGGCRPVWVGRPPRAQPVGRPAAGRSRRGRRPVSRPRALAERWPVKERSTRRLARHDCGPGQAAVPARLRGRWGRAGLEPCVLGRERGRGARASGPEPFVLGEPAARAAGRRRRRAAGRRAGRRRAAARSRSRCASGAPSSQPIRTASARPSTHRQVRWRAGAGGPMRWADGVGRAQGPLRAEAGATAGAGLPASRSRRGGPTGSAGGPTGGQP